MAPQWKVVGGGANGGIIIRSGQDLKSPQTDERLATGAIVEELQLIGQRLQFKKVSGDGPDEGWASTELKGNELLVRVDENGSSDALPPIDVAARCKMEWAKPTIQWTPVTMEALENEAKTAKGKIYGMDFPWNQSTLVEMGARWLTKAYHKAQSIPSEVQVTKVKNVKPYIGGGACAKLVWDVEYDRKCQGIQTGMFAKIPFSMDPETRSDRMAQSVATFQAGELGEINVSRLLEATLPFKIPKYYYGDFSNETTNWILITERIAFSPWSKKKLQPFDIEPPYEKMMDWNLRGDPSEYYFELMRVGGRMAGHYKAGKLASIDQMDVPFGNLHLEYKKAKATDLPAEWTGLQPGEFNAKIRLGCDFISTVAKNLFPEDERTPEFVDKYKNILVTVNAYKQEILWYSNIDEDYCAWAHGNLNVDNSYFWRDAEGKLEAGVLDLNGSVGSLGQKLWWWLYGCEPDFLAANADDLLQCFIDSYHQEGGPLIKLKELKMHFILAAMDQGVGLLGAVPQIYRMCKKKEFESIKDRFDKRISENIDGKNTLRLYVGGFCMMTTLIKEWKVDKWVEEFLETLSKMSGKPKKKLDL